MKTIEELKYEFDQALASLELAAKKYNHFSLKHMKAERLSEKAWTKYEASTKGTEKSNYLLSKFVRLSDMTRRAYEAQNRAWPEYQRTLFQSDVAESKYREALRKQAIN